jgi:hypothetical protein
MNKKWLEKLKLLSIRFEEIEGLLSDGNLSPDNM